MIARSIFLHVTPKPVYTSQLSILPTFSLLLSAISPERDSRLGRFFVVVLLLCAAPLPTGREEEEEPFPGKPALEVTATGSLLGRPRGSLASHAAKRAHVPAGCRHSQETSQVRMMIGLLERSRGRS